MRRDGQATARRCGERQCFASSCGSGFPFAAQRVQYHLIMTDDEKAFWKPPGEILPGRQFPQPTRSAIREFHQAAEALLEHPTIWFDEPMRNAIARGIADAARNHRYTLCACAVCSNHAHVIPRTHRDRAEVIWSHRRYKVFIRSRPDVLGRIDYVNDNPGKEGLPRQHWDFVARCPFDQM